MRIEILKGWRKGRLRVAQDHTDSICSHSFHHFTLIFIRHSYEGRAVHVSFSKYISNGFIARVAWDAMQMLLLAPPTLLSTVLVDQFSSRAKDSSNISMTN